MSANRSFARLSLRTLLLSLVGGGVAIGLLGRLFSTSPQLFSLAVIVLTAVVPYLGVCVALFRIGRANRRPAYVVGGVAAIASPLVGALLCLVAARFHSVTPPGGLAALSNGQLLSTQLPAQVDEPWVWRELESRLAAVDLTPAEVDAAVDVLTNHMATTQPAGWNKPLSWQRGFLEPALASGTLSEPALLRLCDAFFVTTPKLAVVGKPDEGANELRIAIELDSNTWAGHSGLPVRLVWWPERFLLNGAPLPPPELSDRDYANRLSGDVDNRRWTCGVPLPAPLGAGGHELATELAFAFIDADKLVGLPKGASPSDRWPTARKRWIRRFSTGFKARDPAAPHLRLSTNPAHDPQQTGAFAVGRLVLQADRPGKSRLLYSGKPLNGEPIPLAFRVSVRLAGETYALGRVGAYGGSTIQMNRKGVVLPTPGVEVVSADLILEPNPSLLEDRGEVTEIWGEPIEVFGVPVERLDLEARSGAARERDDST